MKRLLLLILILALLLTGCGWMDGYHVSVTPHRQPSTGGESRVYAAENYLQLRTALEEMVSAGVTSRVISAANFEQEQLKNSVDMALRHIRNTYPIGAYAVEEITCEVGTSGGVTAVAVDVVYRHERGDLQKIRHVKDMEQARALIGNALTGYDASLVMLIDDYQATDIHQLVDDYAELNPSSVMQTPDISEQIYPNTGRQRVLELKFTYQSSRDSLRAMQEQVKRIFESASLYVSADDQDSRKLTQLYSFLTERFGDYQIKTSITPAYSLLNHGVGDSHAFASVYSEMCRRAGLECMVVVGSFNGEPLCWNMVRDNGYYYHVDLLACIERGGYRKMTDDMMANYVWDYSAYPACTGEPEPPATEKPPEETTEPTQMPTEAETLPPAETMVPETEPQE